MDFKCFNTDFETNAFQQIPYVSVGSQSYDIITAEFRVFVYALSAPTVRDVVLRSSGISPNTALPSYCSLINGPVQTGTTVSQIVEMSRGNTISLNVNIPIFNYSPVSNVYPSSSDPIYTMMLRETRYRFFSATVQDIIALSSLIPYMNPAANSFPSPIVAKSRATSGDLEILGIWDANNQKVEFDY